MASVSFTHQAQLCVCASLSLGEGHRADLDDIVAAALEYYGEVGLLDHSPLPIALEKEKDPRLAQSPLRYPGGEQVWQGRFQRDYPAWLNSPQLTVRSNHDECGRSIHYC